MDLGRLMFLSCVCSCDDFVRVVKFPEEKNEFGGITLIDSGLKCARCGEIISAEDIRKRLKIEIGAMP